MVVAPCLSVTLATSNFRGEFAWSDQATGLSGLVREDEGALQPDRDSTAGWIAAGVLALGLLFVWLARKLLTRWRIEWRERRHEREQAYFQRLTAACRSSDPAAAWPALVA